MAPDAEQATPNILVILVDQLRFPQWLSAATLAPRAAAEHRAAAPAARSAFARHYTASNDCTPARAAMLTGLYTHQTGCMITGGSTLDPGFPTWGTMLREHGYHTRWYGKWHLTHHDNWWNAISAASRRSSATASPGARFPRPTARPARAGAWIPHRRASSRAGSPQEGASAPVVHDRLVREPPRHRLVVRVEQPRRPPSAPAPRTVRRLPPNFETPELLLARGKPRLQRSLQATAATSFGPVPFHGARRRTPVAGVHEPVREAADARSTPTSAASSPRCQSQPDVAANTVVVFTSDHGEYGGLPRPARQGRGRLRGGASACR